MKQIESPIKWGTETSWQTWSSDNAADSATVYGQTYARSWPEKLLSGSFSAT
jgi:hypothetical protein